MDHLTQADIDLLTNHINSYTREKLGDKTSYEAFSFFYGQDILDKLGAVLIPANEVILKPSLLKK